MSLPDESDGALVEQARAVAAFKKVVLLTAGSAMQRFGEKLQDEQEVLSYIADIVIETFAAESAVLRAQAAQSESNASLHVDAASTYVQEAAGRIELAARSCLSAMNDGDTLRTQLAALRRLLKVTPVNAVAMRRRLADATVSGGGYPLYMA